MQVYLRKPLYLLHISEFASRLIVSKIRQVRARRGSFREVSNYLINFVGNHEGRYVNVNDSGPKKC